MPALRLRVRLGLRPGEGTGHDLITAPAVFVGVTQAVAIGVEHLVLAVECKNIVGAERAVVPAHVVQGAREARGAHRRADEERVFVGHLDVGGRNVGFDTLGAVDVQRHLALAVVHGGHEVPFVVAHRCGIGGTLRRGSAVTPEGGPRCKSRK